MVFVMQTTQRRAYLLEQRRKQGKVRQVVHGVVGALMRPSWLRVLFAYMYSHRKERSESPTKRSLCSTPSVSNGGVTTSHRILVIRKRRSNYCVIITSNCRFALKK